MPPPAPATWRVLPLPELFANHDEFRPPTTDDLVGLELQLHVQDGPRLEIVVEDRTLRWGSDRILPWGAEGVEEYEAVAVRDGLYAVTTARLRENTSALVILDRRAGRVLANLTTFEESDGEVRERTTFLEAGVDGPLREPFSRTTELVGKRVAQRYSTTHAFEHIYLNPNTYAFQGLAGPEAGIAAVDPADYWKLGDELYLLSWHERMRPFNGAVVIDLTAGHATGRLVGWDERDRRTMQVRTGSTSTLLSVASYDGI